MFTRRIGKIILTICVVALLVTTFASCKDKPLDEATLCALRDYLNKSEIEIQSNCGEFNGCRVVSVSSNAISNGYFKETINGIEFCYAPLTRLFVVKDGNIYTVKEAFLNLLLDTPALKKLKRVYKTEKSSIEYVEIGEEIVLDKKSTFDQRTYGGEYSFECVDVLVDRNFNTYYFTEKDFPMLDLKSVEYVTDWAFEQYNGIYPSEFHHTIRLTLTKTGKNEVLKAAKILAKLDFVCSAHPQWFSTRW